MLELDFDYFSEVRLDDTSMLLYIKEMRFVRPNMIISFFLVDGEADVS